MEVSFSRLSESVMGMFIGPICFSYSSICFVNHTATCFAASGDKLIWALTSRITLSFTGSNGSSCCTGSSEKKKF